jgi:hypothetical protein
MVTEEGKRIQVGNSIIRIRTGIQGTQKVDLRKDGLTRGTGTMIETAAGAVTDMQTMTAGAETEKEVDVIPQPGRTREDITPPVKGQACPHVSMVVEAVRTDMKNIIQHREAGMLTLTGMTEVDNTAAETTSHASRIALQNQSSSTSESSSPNMIRCPLANA